MSNPPKEPNDGPGQPPALPDPSAIMGADAPCAPIVPPPPTRRWDAELGRWVREGISIPPDPAGVSYAPSTEPALTRADLELPPTQPVDDLDAPLPSWVLPLVAAMFVVGLALGLLFTVLM